MKKLLVSLLISTMVFAFAACGSSSDGASVKLGQYTGLSADKNVYTISQDAVDEVIQSDLESIADQKILSSPSKDGNYMSLLFTISVDGEVVEDYGEDGYDIILGDWEYGEDFDKGLTGLKAGDSFDFTIPYDDSTATVTGTVNSVYEMIPPKYTKDAVKDLGYDSKDEYEQDVLLQLTEQYEEESQYLLLESIFDQIIEGSTFKNTDSKMDEYFEEYVASYTDYAEMFGMEYEQMLETFGISEDDIKAEAEQAMKRALVVEEIAKKEGISFSDEEFNQVVADAAEDEGFPDSESYIEEYGEDTIRNYLLEQYVSDFLIENTNITEVESEYTAD